MRSAGLTFVQRVDDGHVIAQQVGARPVADAGNGDCALPKLVLDGLIHPNVGIQRAAGEEDGGGRDQVRLAKAPAVGEGEQAAAVSPAPPWRLRPTPTRRTPPTSSYAPAH